MSNPLLVIVVEESLSKKNKKLKDVHQVRGQERDNENDRFVYRLCIYDIVI